MLLLIALHFGLAAVAPALTRLLDRRVFAVLALGPAVSFAWLLPHVGRVTSGGGTEHWRFAWIGQIGLDLDFALTPLSGILSLLVTGIGALVFVYCTWYFKPGDGELWRFSSVFTAFAGSMLALVASDNVYLLYTSWELTTVLSFLLIGHNPGRRANRRAATNALLVTTFGGLSMLIGLVALAHQAGTASLTAIVSSPPNASAITTAAVLLVAVGALSKSAIVPFHFWLPGAMAAPTPVSAYLHAAAMVKAGVFLIAFLAPAFADTPGWRPTMMGLGLLTMLLGGLRALRQYDLKLLLAYGTVSQLGFLVAMAATGTRAAAFAALSLVCAHALFKSALFLIVGVIDRSAGTRDLRQLSAVGRARPALAVAGVLSAASMAGVPPLFGFTAKEAALAAYLDLGHDLGPHVNTAFGTLALAGIVLGSILTVAYSARFVWGAFATKRDVAQPELTRFPIGFTAVPVLITAATVAAGFSGRWLTARVSSYSDDLPEGAHAPVLALWHGLNPALGLSALCIATGVLLFAGRRRVAAVQHAVTDALPMPDAEHAYGAVLRGLDRVSVEVTSRTQSGSLPIYAGIILLTFIAIPGTAALRAWHHPDVRIADNWLQPAVAIVIVVAAIMTVPSSRRLRAVLLAGITGYGTALLFIAHGAPDLALTQVLVETFLLVTFVLVLRRLPPTFSDRPFAASRWLRRTIGVASGMVVAVVGIVAANARTAAPISQGYRDPAYEYGGGRNIVNVTLVDIRAWDTLGELSVLVVAATGIASLIFLITDRSGSRPRPTGEDDPGPWLGSSLRPERRSIVFEIVTRLIFHTMVVLSLYLMLVGHNAPGGGFAGGLIAGLALCVRYLAGGRRELDNAAPVDAGVVLGSGLALAALAGLVPTLLGGSVLQSAIVDIHVPLLGTLHLVTSVFFDIGVYLVVAGLSLDVLRSLGSGIDQQAADQHDSDQHGGEVAIG